MEFPLGQPQGYRIQWPSCIYGIQETFTSFPLGFKNKQPYIKHTTASLCLTSFEGILPSSVCSQTPQRWGRQPPVSFAIPPQALSPIEQSTEDLCVNQGLNCEVSSNTQWLVAHYTDLFKRRHLQTTQNFSITSSWISFRNNSDIGQKLPGKTRYTASGGGRE